MIGRISPDPELLQDSGTTLSARTARDIDFQKMKAIAMACDNGTAFPSSPAVGQWFLQVPSGSVWRNLFQYNGSSWSPMIGLSNITMYVDYTLGTDSQANGHAAGASAFKTISYALGQLPLQTLGNITINLSADTHVGNTFAPIKYWSGTLTIQGYNTTTGTSQTLTGGTQGSVSAQPTISSAAFTDATWEGKIIKFTSGSNATSSGLHTSYRVVDKWDGATTLTLCGNPLAAAPVASDTIEVYPLTSICSGRLVFASGLRNVNINDVAFSYASGYGADSQGDQINWTRCLFTSYYGINCASAQFGLTRVQDCSFKTTGAGTLGAFGQFGGNIVIYRSRMLNAGSGTTYGVSSSRVSFHNLREGTVIDGFTNGTAADGQAFMTFGGGSGSTVITFRNCATGINYQPNGWATGLANCVFVNCTTPIKTTQTEIAGGVVQSLNGTIFGQTADKAVTGTSETSMFGTGIGTKTYPANGWAAGKSVRVTLYGMYSTDATPGNLNIKFKLGSTVIVTTGNQALAASVTNQYWKLELLCTCRTIGASGTFIAQSSFSHQDSSGTIGPMSEWAMTTSSTVTVDTTAAQAIDATAQFDNSGNTLTSYIGTIEVIN